MHNLNFRAAIRARSAFIPTHRRTSRKAGRNHGIRSTLRSRQEHPRLVDERGAHLLADEGQGGRGVRQPRIQRQSAAGAVAEGGVSRIASHHYSWRDARCVDRRRGRDRVEGLGGRTRCDALHALVPAAHGHHRREARFVSRALQRRQRDRRVPRQGIDQRRARRIELPVRRHALHLRGPRLHGVGSHEPAMAPRQRQ